MGTDDGRDREASSDCNSSLSGTPSRLAYASTSTCFQAVNLRSGGHLERLSVLSPAGLPVAIKPDAEAERGTVGYFIAFRPVEV